MVHMLNGPMYMCVSVRPYWPLLLYSVGLTQVNTHLFLSFCPTLLYTIGVIPFILSILLSHLQSHFMASVHMSSTPQLLLLMQRRSSSLFP